MSASSSAGEARATPPVAVRELSKIYHPDDAELRVVAVDAISFSVPRGESLAVVGPSGCGKSSLLNMLGCLDQPTSGVYELEGRDVATRSGDELAAIRNRHIGFVFQSFNLLPRMDAAENVELPLLYSGADRPRERALDALARVGLADRATHLPNELSGGQKQRVAIARALVTEPSILLCDEPTGALDTKTGADVIDLLLRLNEEGATLVMVTHDLKVARSMKRAIRMRDGAIIADGDSRAVVDALAREELSLSDEPREVLS